MSATLPDKFAEQNWTEDYVDGDNGCYMHHCSDCGRVFLGHKRRPRQCRICAIPKATREQLADLRAQLQAANERAKKAEAALHQCLAITGEEAGDRDDFRALVNREQVTVDAVKELRERAERAEIELGHLHGRIGLFAAKWWLLSDNLPTDETFKQIEDQLADTANKHLLLMGKLEASEQTSAALKAEVDRLLHERNEIAEKSVLPYRDQLNALVREAEKVVVERDAARALNDRLAGALNKLKGACKDVLLPAINKAIENGHKMETWSPAYMQLVTATQETDAALSAYAKSKEGAK